MENDKGVKIIGGNGVRIDFDFYPTPKECTVALLSFMNWPRMVIWEPACGEMAMSNVLSENGHQVYSTDINKGQDFFSTDPQTRFDAIITNPPFKYAEKFIRKAIIDADISAMLLKTQYWHASKRTKLFEDNPPAFILALNWRPNFFGELATGSPTMDFIWTVWIKGETDTRFRILSKPTNQ